MDIQITGNYELIFAISGIIISFFCGRISIIFARGGVTDYNILSLIFGTGANLVWVSSVIWFFLEGQWLIPIVVILVSLFGFLTLVSGHTFFWRIRHLLRFMAIACLLGTWHTHLI